MITPKQFGPMIRIPPRRPGLFLEFDSVRPDSLKPAERITAPLTLLLHTLPRCRTVAAGVAITAKSTGAGTPAMLSKAGFQNGRPTRLTDTRAAKGAQVGHKSAPILPGVCDAPMTATDSASASRSATAAPPETHRLFHPYR